MENLTPDEMAAVAALRKLQATWPESLWLFSASGSLWVMKKKGGKRIMPSTGGFEQEAVVTKVNIESDGGDW